MQIPSREAKPVIDVDERTFEAAVIARSREVPVVVDFWAPWCGPCRTLGPLLERLAHEAKGAFVLAKINVDQNPRLAAAFRVQGIPAVKAVRDGKVIDEFTGAQPESQVRAWLKRFVPTPDDQLMQMAAELEASDPEAAAARYRLLLGSDPQNAAALFGLGRLLLMYGDPEGVAVLRDVPTGTPFYPRVQAVLALTDFFALALDANLAGLEQQVARNANDLEARYRLAAALVRVGRYEPALEHLLTIVQRNRALHDDGARKAMLGLFALLGDEAPVVGAYRRKLANVLF